jgi:hypothetical protein
LEDAVRSKTWEETEIEIWASHLSQFVLIKKILKVTRQEFLGSVTRVQSIILCAEVERAVKKYLSH